MPLVPFPVDQYGGFNLLVNPTDVGMGGAVDLLNVDFDHPGRLRTRDGTAQWNGSTLSASGYSGLYGSGTSSSGAVAAVLQAVRYSTGGNVNIDQLTSTGTTTNIGSFSGAAGTFPMSHADWGIDPASAPLNSPLGSYSLISFVTQPSTGVTLKSVPNPTTGSGVSDFISPAGKPIFVAVAAQTNRIVQAGYFASGDTPSAANGTRSTVFFSDQLAATYTSTNWVMLRPGDGQVITGMVAFGNEIFVFKQSSVFVFYGESLESDGTPIFNYRRIDLPEPLADPVPNAPFATYAVAGPDGVYYSTPSGIWKLTANGAARFDTPVSKIFSNDATVSSSLRNGSNTPPSLSWAGGKLFASYASAASATRQLVWDPRVGQWTLYDLPAFAFADYPLASSVLAHDSAFYVRGSGNNNVFVQRPASTDDSGVAIPWSYTTGYSSAGGYFRQRIVSSGERKKHFKTDILGSGTATHQLLALNARPNDVADTGGTVTLGTAPALARGSRRRGVRGTHFAHKLSGSGPVVISGLTYWLSEISLDT